MPPQGTNSQELDSWQALRVRSTTFLPADEDIDEASLWGSVVGGSPEEEQRRPGEGLLQQVGTLSGLVVVLRIVHPRIDWFIQPRSQARRAPSDVSDWELMPFEDAVQTIAELSSTWFSDVNRVNRIAFGANLVRPADDLPQACSALMTQLCGVNIDIEGSLDFLYQVNRPRQSSILGELTINRLSKWAIMVEATSNLLLPGNIGSGEMLFRQGTRRYASSLELDINTSADRTLGSSSSDLSRIFEELTTLGKQISLEGDV